MRLGDLTDAQRGFDRLRPHRAHHRERSAVRALARRTRRLRSDACPPTTSPPPASRADGLAQICSPAADVISIHVPLTEDHTRLIGAAELARMHDAGAVIVNTSRGGIIDEAALAEALEAGTIGGAGIDVFEAEPPPADHPLFALDNVGARPACGRRDRGEHEAHGAALRRSRRNDRERRSPRDAAESRGSVPSEADQVRHLPQHPPARSGASWPARPSSAWPTCTARWASSPGA